LAEADGIFASEFACSYISSITKDVRYMLLKLTKQKMRRKTIKEKEKKKKHQEKDGYKSKKLLCFYLKFCFLIYLFFHDMRVAPLLIELLRCLRVLMVIVMQMSLAAARKSLVADNAVGLPGKLDASSTPHYYDSEDNTSMGSRTPGGSTPIKSSGTNHDVGAGRDTNGTLDAVSNLVKEFEQRRQAFDNGAKAIVEVKAGQSASLVNSDDELRKLKLGFEVWKREFKIRLRDTKAKLHKLGRSEGRYKWWGKLSSRAS
jgi:hypothetical protein